MTLDIAKLRELLAAAVSDPPVAGMVPSLPWHVEDDGNGFKAIYSIEQHNDGHNVSIATDLRAADAALICAAVNALPELLAIAEAAEKLADDVRISIAHLSGARQRRIRESLAAVDAARKETP